MSILITAAVICLVCLIFLIRLEFDIDDWRGAVSASVGVVSFIVLGIGSFVIPIPENETALEKPNNWEVVKYQEKTWLQIKDGDNLELRLLDEQGRDVQISFYERRAFWKNELPPTRYRYSVITKSE